MRTKTLLISGLLITCILTGCNGQSATATIETETTTEIESTAEVESTTTEPESTTEVESTTFETEPVPAIEDVTITEEEIAAKFDESVFTEDVTEAQKERLRKISKAMDLSYLDLADIDGDGKITGTEAHDFIDAYDTVMGDFDITIPDDILTTGGGSGSGNHSSNNYIDDGIQGTPDSGELPTFEFGQGDYSGLSDTGHPY